MARDRRLARMRHLRVELLAEAELDGQHAGVAATKQRERAVRRHRLDRLGVVVVVAEFLAFLAFLALDHGRRYDAALEQVVAQLAEQLGRLAELLGQDVARAVEGRLHVGDALVRVHVRGGFRLRIEERIREERLRERLEPGFPGDLRARAALRLVRQVQILERLLAVGRVDRRAQFVGQLALLVDARDDRRAAFLELAQIQEALFELAQLRVVQVARDFLPVAGDERNGGAFVEELHRRGDLPGLDRQFVGDALYDLECYGFRHVVMCVYCLQKSPGPAGCAVEPAQAGEWSGAFCHKCERG